MCVAASEDEAANENVEADLRLLSGCGFAMKDTVASRNTKLSADPTSMHYEGTENLGLQEAMVQLALGRWS